MRIGSYYEVTNKRLKEWFIIKWLGKEIAFIYTGTINKKESCFGTVSFPIEQGDKIKKITEERVFLEVV